MDSFNVFVYCCVCINAQEAAFFFVAFGKKKIEILNMKRIEHYVFVCKSSVRNRQMAYVKRRVSYADGIEFLLFFLDSVAKSGVCLLLFTDEAGFK